MRKSTAVLLGVGALAAAGVAYLIMSRPHAAQAAPAPTTAPSPTQQECSCPSGWNPGIMVVNDQRQLVPGAEVYIDGQYVGTTGSSLTDMGMISSGFTSCQWHDVTVVACDGTTASATLGYWCYPGHAIVDNVIVVPTDDCGGSMIYAGPI